MIKGTLRHVRYWLSRDLDIRSVLTTACRETIVNVKGVHLVIKETGTTSLHFNLTTNGQVYHGKSHTNLDVARTDIYQKLNRKRVVSELNRKYPELSKSFNTSLKIIAMLTERVGKFDLNTRGDQVYLTLESPSDKVEVEITTAKEKRGLVTTFDFIHMKSTSKNEEELYKHAVCNNRVFLNYLTVLGFVKDK